MTKHMVLSLLHVVSVWTLAAGKSALLLIDVQDCFLEANTTSGQPGSLQVTASHIIPVINKIREKDCLFDVVVLSRDYHPANHVSFGSTHGLEPFSHLTDKGGLPITCVLPQDGNTKDASCCPTQHLNSNAVDCSKQLCPPDGWSWAADNEAFVKNNPACTQCADNPSSCFSDEQAMWTDHCLQDGDSTFPPSLTTKDTDILVRKGGNVYVDAYSAFMDNSQNLKTELDDTLQSHGVDTLYVAGIATSVCVRWTVRDALGENTAKYTVNVISDASAGLDGAGHEESLEKMKEYGATIVTSDQVVAMVCSADASGAGALAQVLPLLWAVFFYVVVTCS